MNLSEKKSIEYLSIANIFDKEHIVLLENSGTNYLKKALKETTYPRKHLLLKEKIDTIKEENPNDWNQLISYNVNTKWSKNARQDVCKCIQPKYDKHELFDV